MKKTFALAVMLAAISMTACQDDLHVADGLSAETAPNNTTKYVTFNVTGDFSSSWQQATRGTVLADGQEITDLWIFDYQNGALVQQIHQTSKDEKFGAPSLCFNMGSHHVYFVASSGTDPSLSTSKHTIIWDKVGDTFYKDLALYVDGSISGNQTVTLDRSVTKLNLTIVDAIKEGTSSFIVVPHLWYYGIDYFTGRPTSPKTEQPVFLECPSSKYGQTQSKISVFGFSSTTEWKNNVSLYATDGTFVTAHVDIKDAPFKRNCATEYFGSLFGTEGIVSVTINDIWDGVQSSTW